MLYKAYTAGLHIPQLLQTTSKAQERFLVYLHLSVLQTFVCHSRPVLDLQSPCSSPYQDLLRIVLLFPKPVDLFPSQAGGRLSSQTHLPFAAWMVENGLSLGTLTLPENTSHHHNRAALSLNYSVLLRGFFCPDRQSTEEAQLTKPRGKTHKGKLHRWRCCPGWTDRLLIHSSLLATAWPQLSPHLSNISLRTFLFSSVWRFCLCLHTICSARILTMVFLLGPGSQWIPIPHHALHLVLLSQHLPEGVSPELVKAWGMQSQYLMAKGQSASCHLTPNTFGCSMPT